MCERIAYCKGSDESGKRVADRRESRAKQTGQRKAPGRNGEAESRIGGPEEYERAAQLVDKTLNGLARSRRQHHRGRSNHLCRVITKPHAAEQIGARQGTGSKAACPRE